MKIYLASSWRNKLHAGVLAALREDEHDVYDFKNPIEGDTGFSWRQIGDRFGKCKLCGEQEPGMRTNPCAALWGKPDKNGEPDIHSGHQWEGGWDAAYFAKDVLDHPVAARGFGFDMAALDAASACVLVNPCGRSAHLELGYAVGQGKLTVVYFPELDEPELMIRMCDYVVTTLSDLRLVLSQSRPPPRWQRDVAEYDVKFPAFVKATYPENCRPYVHRECKECKGCWRHGTCICGPKEPKT